MVRILRHSKGVTPFSSRERGLCVVSIHFYGLPRVCLRVDVYRSDMNPEYFSSVVLFFDVKSRVLTILPLLWTGVDRGTIETIDP